MDCLDLIPWGHGFSWGLISLIVFSLSLPHVSVAQGVDCEAYLTAKILPSDETKLSQYAREKNLLIILIPPNPHSFQYQSQKGYKAKVLELKPCKSAWVGTKAGLVHCPPEIFSSPEEWEAEISKLHGLGYRVLGPEEFYLVQDENGKFFYSDYDIQGMYTAQGQHAYTEENRQEMNQLLGRRMFRHAPLDDYDQREDIGLKFPLLAFLPTGERTVITSYSEQRALYAAYNVDLDLLWGDRPRLRP
jgi:hypothetical protein